MTSVDRAQSNLLSIRDHESLEWESVGCNLCGTSTTSFTRRRTYHQLQCDLIYNLCLNCDLLYLNPRPTTHSLTKLYASREYFQGGSKSIGYSDYLGEESFRRKTARAKLLRLEQMLGRKGRLLEIGCAAGFFAVEARDRGWQVTGIDISQPMVDYARNKFSLEAYAVSLEALDPQTHLQIRQDSFDVVTCWGTTSNFVKPLDNFRKINGLLKDSGIFIFNATNHRSLTAHFFGSHWFLYGPSSAHIYSRGSIRKLLKISGFVERKISLDWYHLTLSKFVSKLPVLLGRSFNRWPSVRLMENHAFSFPNLGYYEVIASKK